MSFFKNKIKNIPLKKRLIVFMGILMFFVATLLLLSIRTVVLTKKQTAYMKGEQLESIAMLSKISDQINTLVLYNHVLIEKKTSIVELQSVNHHKIEEINELLDKYQESITTINQTIYFEYFRTQFQDYQNVVQEVFNFIKNNKNESVNLLLTNKEIASYEQLKLKLKEIKKYNQINFNERHKILSKNLNRHVLISITITIFSFLIIALITTLSIIDIRGNYSEIKERLTKLGKGEVFAKNMRTYKSELGELGVHVNKISDNIKRIEIFTNHIEKDDYNFDLVIKGEHDFTGQSLIRLKENLLKAKKEQEQRKLEDQRKSWAREGIAKFGEVMRQSSDNIQTLTDDVIKNIVLYLDAKIGGLFIYDETDTDNRHLYLISSFAYDRKKYFSKKIRLGDGLIGTAAIDKTTIYLEDIPEDYIEIESGLGDATPKSLFIIPLKTERGLLGVLEIASFKKIEEFERDFLIELAETIASTLETVKINARTIELLNESERNSKELASRENELRSTMQQVQQAQEESERRTAEMSSILSAVDQTLLKLEIGTDGRIMSANQRYLRTFSYLQEEIRERNLKDILPENEKSEYVEIIRELNSGQTHRGTYKFITEGGKNVWLLSQFAPIMGANNNLIRILYLAIDITEQKEIEERNSKLLGESVNKADELMKAHSAVKQNEIEMQDIMTAIDQTLMKAEYSVAGNLVSANEKHITTMGYDFEKTKGKNIKSFIPEEEEDEFNKVWNRVQQGEMQQITVKRTSQTTGRNIWLLNQYTPIRDNKSKVLKVLYLAIDITEQKEAETRNNILLQQAREKEETLMTSQELMRYNELELKGVLSAVDQTLMKAEYSSAGNLLSANEKHITTMGYDFEKMKGKNIKSFIPEEEEQQFNEVWEKVTKGEMQQITVKRKNSNGKTIWLLNQYTPVLNKKNKIIKILYLANEITEQKEIEESNKKLLQLADNKEAILVKAQKRMMRNEREMKGILSAIDQTLMKAEYSKEGIFLSANEKHHNIFGYDYEKTVGKNIRSFIPKDEEDEFIEVWKKVLNGKMQQITVRREDKDSKTIWLLNQYTPILDRNNEIIKILYLASDVTEQKINEERLLKNQQKMKVNEREMNAIISAVDQTLMKAEYSIGGRLLTANQKHIDIMGYDFATTKGSDIITFIPENEIEDFMKMWEIVKTGKSQQLTVKRTNRETGQDIWLLNQYTPVINEKNKVFKILYIAIDITKQKESEEELKQQEESMRLNMEELFSVQMELEEELENYKNKETELKEEFDTELDKKYNEWLTYFE